MGLFITTTPSGKKKVGLGTYMMMLFSICALCATMMTTQAQNSPISPTQKPQTGWDPSGQTTVEGIPVEKTSSNTLLVGWRAGADGTTALWDSNGGDNLQRFTAKGDLAIGRVVESLKGQKVLGIVPIITANSNTNSGTSRVCGVWIILEPQ